MYEWGRDKIVKNRIFGSTITVDKQGDNVWCLLKMVKTKAWLKNMENN